MVDALCLLSYKEPILPAAMKATEQSSLDTSTTSRVAAALVIILPKCLCRDRILTILQLFTFSVILEVDEETSLLPLLLH